MANVCNPRRCEPIRWDTTVDKCSEIHVHAELTHRYPTVSGTRDVSIDYEFAQVSTLFHMGMTQYAFLGSYNMYFVTQCAGCAGCLWQG